MIEAASNTEPVRERILHELTEADVCTEAKLRRNIAQLKYVTDGDYAVLPLPLVEPQQHCFRRMHEHAVIMIPVFRHNGPSLRRRKPPGNISSPICRTLPPIPQMAHRRPGLASALFRVAAQRLLEMMAKRGDNSAVTVIADSEKRVVLPEAKPGDRFDLRTSADGTVILAKLQAVPARSTRVTVEKRGGYSVGVLDHPIDEQALTEALAEFP